MQILKGMFFVIYKHNMKRHQYERKKFRYLDNKFSVIVSD